MSVALCLAKAMAEGFEAGARPAVRRLARELGVWRPLPWTPPCSRPRNRRSSAPTDADRPSGPRCEEITRRRQFLGPGRQLDGPAPTSFKGLPPGPDDGPCQAGSQKCGLLGQCNLVRSAQQRPWVGGWVGFNPASRVPDRQIESVNNSASPRQPSNETRQFFLSSTPGVRCRGGLSAAAAGSPWVAGHLFIWHGPGPAHAVVLERSCSWVFGRPTALQCEPRRPGVPPRPPGRRPVGTVFPPISSSHHLALWMYVGTGSAPLWVRADGLRLSPCRRPEIRVGRIL